MKSSKLAWMIVGLAAALSPASARPDWTGPHGAWHGGTGWHHGGEHWHRHSHGGLILFGSPLFWPGRRDPFDDPFYPFPPTPLVAQPPPVYIERGEGSPPQLAPGSLWYYCEAAGAYYPYVKECPGGWKAVAPQPAQR